MKIYYIINGRLPTEKANGYQISQMCQAFEENGAKVELLRPCRHLDPKHLPFKNNLKGFYNLRVDLKVIDIWSFDFQYYFHRLGSVFDRLQFLTNLFHTLSFVLGLGIYLKKRMRAWDDVLYLRDVNILSWLHPFLNYDLKKNSILELHYLPETLPKRKRYIRILNRARTVVCITEKMKQDLIELGYPSEKIWVEHDGVDLGTFNHNLSKEECRIILGYPTDALIVGYVGNFHTNGQEKGVDDLIRSAKLILAQKPEVQFYFVGGPMARVPYYESIIQQLQLPRGNFHFFDRRPVSQVPISMSACDVLTIPLPWNPHFAFYMSPMKLFEYMSTGRPIVATDIQSLKEILNHNENSFLAQHSNIKDLAEKILFALNNPEKCLEVAQKAKDQVVYHTWKNRASRVLKFIGD